MTNGWNGLRKELVKKNRNKIMKKAVAIPYVIALILGIAVIGLIGYWFISQGGKTIATGLQAECDSLCVAWRSSGFNIKPTGIDQKCPGKDYSKCALDLGCSFVSISGSSGPIPTSCPANQINYGVKDGKSVCCTS